MAKARGFAPTKAAAWLLVLLAGLGLSAYLPLAHGEDAPPAPSLARGEHLYFENCAACHNSSGRVGPRLKEAAAYFVSAGVPPEALGKLILPPLRMRPKDSRMPVFKPGEVTDADVDAIGLYLASGHPLPETIPAPGDGARGAELFKQNCAVCHGAKAQGKGKAPSLAAFAASLRDSGAPPPAMLGFVSYATRSGDLPEMSTFAESELSATDLSDIAAFLWALAAPAQR